MQGSYDKKKGSYDKNGVLDRKHFRLNQHNISMTSNRPYNPPAAANIEKSATQAVDAIVSLKKIGAAHREYLEKAISNPEAKLAEKKAAEENLKLQLQDLAASVISLTGGFKPESQDRFFGVPLNNFNAWLIYNEGRLEEQLIETLAGLTLKTDPLKAADVDKLLDIMKPIIGELKSDSISPAEKAAFVSEVETSRLRPLLAEEVFTEVSLGALNTKEAAFRAGTLIKVVSLLYDIKSLAQLCSVEATLFHGKISNIAIEGKGLSWNSDNGKKGYNELNEQSLHTLCLSLLTYAKTEHKLDPDDNVLFKDPERTLLVFTNQKTRIVIKEPGLKSFGILLQQQ